MTLEEITILYKEVEKTLTERALHTDSFEDKLQRQLISARRFVESVWPNLLHMPQFVDLKADQLQPVEAVGELTSVFFDNLGVDGGLIFKSGQVALYASRTWNFARDFSRPPHDGFMIRMGRSRNFPERQQKYPQIFWPERKRRPYMINPLVNTVSLNTELRRVVQRDLLGGNAGPNWYLASWFDGDDLESCSSIYIVTARRLSEFVSAKLASFEKSGVTGLQFFDRLNERSILRLPQEKHVVQTLDFEALRQGLTSCGLSIFEKTEREDVTTYFLNIPFYQISDDTEQNYSQEVGSWFRP